MTLLFLFVLSYVYVTQILLCFRLTEQAFRSLKNKLLSVHLTKRGSLWVDMSNGPLSLQVSFLMCKMRNTGCPPSEAQIRPEIQLAQSEHPNIFYHPHYYCSYESPSVSLHLNFNLVWGHRIFLSSKKNSRASLAVQWSELQVLIAEGPGLIPGCGTRIPQYTQPKNI